MSTSLIKELEAAATKLEPSWPALAARLRQRAEWIKCLLQKSQVDRAYHVGWEDAMRAANAPDFDDPEYGTAASQPDSERGR